MALPPVEADGLPAGWPQDHGIPTLGTEVLGWAEVDLAQPDGDRAGVEWRWRPTQARFVAWWYALDRQGEWLYRRGQIVLPKGSGKSPIAAALSSCELAGPVVFDGWSGKEPVGRPHPSPWVQLAAVSQDQTDNTMALVLSMMREGFAAKDIPGLDLGLTRVRTRNGVLQPVTASAPSREGQRLTAAILDETHLWLKANGGHRLAATIRRNLAKMNGRSLETTNAWTAGEESVAQKTAEYVTKVREGKKKNLDPRILQWHPSGLVDDLSNRAKLRAALKSLYGDYPWVDISRIIAEIYDLGTSPADARRFYLNQVSEDDDAWIREHEWAAVSKPELVVADGDVITVGFDGSRGRNRGVTDATALMGCRVLDGHLFELGVWEQPDLISDPKAREWTPPIAEVDAVVAETFAKYTVVGFYADPSMWDEHVATWEAKYGPRLKVKAAQSHPIRWPKNQVGRVVEALQRMQAAILNHEMSHAGTSVMTRHFLNARLRQTPRGAYIAKESPESPRKIDAAYAGMLAFQARLDALAAGLGRRRTTAVPTRIR